MVPCAVSFNLYTHLKEHGANREAIAALKLRVNAHQAELDELTKALNQARGAWRAWAVVGTIAGTVGAVVSRLLAHAF